MDEISILIVEDQADSSNVLRAGLENSHKGYRVVQVDSAENALRNLQAASFDLLITDVLLPGISGLELMAQFRHYAPDCKVILLSSASETDSRRAVAQAGAEAFFFKPVDLADILEAAERVLQMSNDAILGAVDIAEADLKTASAQGNAIADEISGLKDSLKALAVLLISERGQVMARAGELPDEGIETNLMPDLMTSFFASLRVGTYVNAERPDNLHCFRGKDFHLHLMSISASYGLLVATVPQNSEKLSKLADKSQISIARLSDLLGEFELPYEPSMELFREVNFGRAADDDSEIDEKLDGLLHEAETRPVSHRKAEKYWKSASREILVHPARGGALTYEQARRLGFTPPDAK
jgi:DNA-binding response OmpR family regulator